MNNSNEQNKTVQVPTFSGKIRDFTVWWMRFRAYTALKKYHNAMGQNFNLPADPLNLTGTDPEKKEQAKLVAMNTACLASLTLAFTTPDLMQLVTASQTDKYPFGIAKQVVKLLFEEYRPEDDISEVEAETELQQLRFVEGQHPEKFFNRLSVLKAKFGQSKKFEEELLIPAILAKSPKEYSGVLTSEKMRLGNAFTLNHMKKTMKTQFRMNNNKSELGTIKEKSKGTSLIHIRLLHIISRFK